ncbi:MAG TPA: hypothetical protein VIQ80_00635 [Candidatus Saccharimonadales bacterium]
MSRQSGYIALIAILITSAVCVAATLGMLTGGTDQQREVRVVQQSMQARGLANACASEALERIREDMTFAGTATLTLGSGTCTLTITSTGASTRMISTTGTVQSVIQKTAIAVTISGITITIMSWQDVS